MADLNKRFATLDRVPAPDLWPAVEQRAELLAANARAQPISAGRPVWRGTNFGGPMRSPARGLAVVVAILALAVMLAGVISVGSALIDPRNHAIVPPTGPSPSARPPTSSPESSVSPTSGVTACAGSDAPAQVRATPIDLPAYILDARFAACSMWVQSEKNGGGIDRINLATNTIVANITPGEVVTAIAVQGDDVWALVVKGVSGPADHEVLERIDPATNAVVEKFALPFRGSLLVIVGREAWIGGAFQDMVTHVFDLDSKVEVARIALAANKLESHGRSVWASSSQAGKQAVSSIDIKSRDVTDIATPAAVNDWTVTDGALFFGTQRGEIVQESIETGEVMRTIKVQPWTDGYVFIDSSGGDVFAQPVDMTPDGTGDLHVSEILRIDARTGDTLDRIGFTARFPAGLWTGGGSLWLADADKPLTRLEVPALP